ncbi:MAG: glutathione S-transferase family protein [Rhodospirillaceae bacterium]|nr:glutathione S-transferase family protein [Rhodospirillaceae bacterium]
MIDLYAWTTDNGFKARQMMEESGLEYTLKPVNIPKQEQFEPNFLKISPGHKIPAIIDHDGPGGNTISLCESGAILKYVAVKAGNGLYPADPLERIKVDQWLFYGSATYTTLAQQFGYFWVRAPEPIEEAKAYYDGVLRDMMSTLDRHLADNEYMAGDYSIADISMYPDTHIHGVERIGLDEYPNLKRWHDVIEARPAVQRAWGPF